MKFNNENSKEQVTYAAPKMRVINVQVMSSLLSASDGLDFDEDSIQKQEGWFTE